MSTSQAQGKEVGSADWEPNDHLGLCFLVIGFATALFETGFGVQTFGSWFSVLGETALVRLSCLVPGLGRRVLQALAE